MKTRRFDFNFRPLQLSVSMVNEAGVAEIQNYDADTDEYTPDYTLVNLIIQPKIGRIDKDEVLTPGAINQDVTNVEWYEVNAGRADTLIDSNNSSYELVTSGAKNGRLTIKKNATPQVPLNLRFEADYRDPRTNQVIHITKTFQVKCKNSTQYIPLLVLDAADQTIYNPLKDQDKQTVHASLRLGKEECPTSKRLFVWEVLREDGTYSAVGADTTLDYDVEVSADGTSCTVDRSLIGNTLFLRCRAKYDVEGNPSSVTLDDSCPTKIISFTRRIPKIEYDIYEVPTNLPTGLEAICPTAHIQDTNGVIDNPERELLPIWYAATNVKKGELKYDLVAHGMKPTLSTNVVSDTLGGVYGLEVKDVGPTCAWEDSDGAVFEDGSGNVLLIK